MLARIALAGTVRMGKEATTSAGIAAPLSVALCIATFKAADMPIVSRILLVILVAAAATLGYRYYDQMRGAEWEVSPQQIAAAKPKMQMGHETSPGTVAVPPIRSETADFLPVQWGLAGLVAGTAAWAATRRRPVGG